MKKYFEFFSFFIGLLLISSCTSKGEIFTDATCIVHVAVVHPEKGLIENQTVIVQGEKILKVIASEELKLSPENNIIDG